MPHLRAGSYLLEYTWYGLPPAKAPTLVFLHEGLGCVSMWRDFPARVAEAVGCGVLVYSRAGYGDSDSIVLPRTVHYMHDEGLISLPQVLDALDIREAILVGHSDGGSIALINAGSSRSERIRGLILEAPHVFIEDITIESITIYTEIYRSGNLKAKLERYHGRNVDSAFLGWSQAWLNPAFRAWNIEEYLSGVHVPVLVIQGEDDQYGTLLQVEAIKNKCSGRVQSIILPNCGHSPHRDQPQLTLEAIVSFLCNEALV